MGVTKYGCRFLTGLVSFILLGVSGAFAQVWPGGGGTTPTCLLSATGFETGSPLCDPQLSNDEDGWFNEDGDPLKAAMKDCDDTQTQPYNVAMEGMVVSITTPSKLFSSTTWNTYLGTQGTEGQAGMTAVYANPKLIDPILSAGNGTNMLVNSGTYHDKQYFLAYTLTGLAPNSTVVMTLDSYYLIDEKSYLTYFDLNPDAANSNKASEKKTFGGALQYNQGKIQYNLKPVAGIKYTYNTTDMNQSTTLNITATSGAQPQRLEGHADEGGNITFYLGRINPSTVPIGIDNIKVYGTVKPEIISGGVPCPEMPTNINLKNSYPPGTEYQWKESKTGKTATTSSFTFLPPSPGEYKFTCSVKLPFEGCASESQIKEYTLKVGKCCESDDGVPMSKVNIYKNDFGKIAGKTYTYTDKSGNVRDVKMTDEGWCGVTGSNPYSTIADQLGGFSGVSYNSKPCAEPGGYALMTNDPYTHMLSDQENPGTGAFMMIDLKEKNFKNPIFEQKIPGLCVKRTLYFQTDIASANNKVDDNIHLTVSISTSSGKVIRSWPHNLGKNNKWISDTASFEVSEKSDLILRIETSDTQFPDDYGDFALDNIMLQVCAPPSIDINDTVLGKEVREKDSMLLNLCTGDTLVLSTHTYEALRNFYGPTMRFMYQYAPKNPEEYDDPGWVTMKDENGQTILTDSVFIIKDPAKHEAFTNIAEHEMVYFRLVIGKEETLKDDSELDVSVQSPCRNVSVSNLVVRARLNCARCTRPDAVKLTADHSTFDKNTMTVQLCKGESTTLSMTNKVHGIDQDNKDYYTYVTVWKKNGTNISGTNKKITKDSPMAPTVDVSWDDVQAAGSAKYTLSIHDAYDPALSETQCDTTVTITVIANPEPEAPTIDDIDLCEKVKPRMELKNRLSDSDFSDYTVNWYSAADPTAATTATVSEPDLDAVTVSSTYYYSVTDKNTLCESPIKQFDVEVHSTSNPLGTMKVSYLVKDTTSSGVFKDLLSQDASAVQTESGYTYIWFDKNQKLYKGDGKSVPVPDVPSLPLTDDVHETYYVARYDNTYGCWSDTLPVEVTIFGAPAPIPEDVYYCVGSSRVVPLTAEINDPNGVGTSNFELVWYDPSKTLIGATAPTPSVAAEGETIYFVSQKSSDGAESSLQPLSVKVYKAHQLSPVSTDTYCDDEQNPRALVKFAEDGATDYDRATDIQWYLYGDAWDNDKLPVLDLKKDTTYVFGAVQSYKVTSALGAELETCYSDTTYYTVNVLYTPPVGDSSVAYIAAEVGGDNKTFPSIDTKEGWSEEPGYTYYYSEAGMNNFSTSIPKPVYDVSNLNGGTTTILYDVYRVKDGVSKECSSEVSQISVSISDAMPPKVKDYHYCEGSTLQPITAEIKPITGKTANDYELYWYTTKPTSTTATPEVTGTTYTLSGTAAVEADGSIKSTTYYVAQHDINTGATSAAMEVHVVVYPKPILTITDPAATCGSDLKFVDITSTWTASNTTETVTPTYSADVPTAVEQSGTYTIKGEYNIPTRAYRGGNLVEVMDNVCVGDEFPVNVEVNYLTVPTIGDQTGVCPGKNITLTASATSTDPGTVTYQWSGYSTQTGSTATAVGDMTTGTNHLFKVTAKAGVCEFTSSDYYVKVGDGPVVGSIDVSEPGNSELPRTLDAFSGDLDSRTLYSCGGEVTVKSNLSKTEGDFEWYDGNTKINTGDVLTILATDQYSEKTYTIKYINECETQTNFRIVTVPLSAEYVGPDTTVVLCEGEVFETKMNVKCQETTPVIQWYRNTTPVGEKKTASTTTVNNYGIESVVKLNDGRYNYEVTNRGCTVKGNADSLVVHPNVKATLDEGPIVVARHGSQTLKLNITVPADGRLSDIEWKRDGESVQTGSSAEYTEMDVVADHNYYVTLNDPEYCGTALISTIWVDAELQLVAKLKDTICMGESEKLYIDTTGTGKFRANNPVELKVILEMNGSTQDLSRGLKQEDGKLVLDVSPIDDAVYTVTFTYGSQNKREPLPVHVIPAISLDLPETVTICEGEETDLTVQNVAPVGTTISWFADETILSATDDSLTVTVKPTYNTETGVNHESTYNYVVVAYNKMCQTYKNYNVYVNVDEPIRGTMEGDSIICDGDESFVDAHNYGATTYLWSTSDGDTLGTMERLAPLRPNHSTIYYADMVRGMCTAKESYTIEVKSLPVIASIDSVGYHSREVTLEAGAGAAPYTIWYDNIPATVDNNTHFDNIPFGVHTMHVTDFYGCETSRIFELDPPEIFIPEYFSPNSDGTNDHWIIPGLSELYPASVVYIYDRYGKLLAQYFGANSEGWDGTYNGQAMPSTDYWYQIDIEEINRQYVGHFTLIRR